MSFSIRIRKADGIGHVTVNDVLIEINAPLPDWRTAKSTLDDARRLFDADAELIMEAFKSLPGGTKHALLVKMLAEKECLLAIPDVPKQ